MFILKKGHQPGVYVPLRALVLVFLSSRILCLYNKDPLTSHIYIGKQEFTWVYIFLIFALTEAVLICTHDLCFEQN